MAALRSFKFEFKTLNLVKIGIINEAEFDAFYLKLLLEHVLAAFVKVKEASVSVSDM